MEFDSKILASIITAAATIVAVVIGQRMNQSMYNKRNKPKQRGTKRTTTKYEHTTTETVEGFDKNFVIRF